MSLRPGPSYKPTGINWSLSTYGANDASFTSAGTISCPTMKFCVIPACSTFRTSSVSEDWVFSVTSPDFEVMYQQTRSYKSAPRRGMVSGLHRSGDAPVVGHRPPWPIPDLPQHECNSDWGPAASGGPTVLAITMMMMMLHRIYASALIHVDDVNFWIAVSSFLLRVNLTALVFGCQQRY